MRLKAFYHGLCTIIRPSSPLALKARGLPQPWANDFPSPASSKALDFAGGHLEVFYIVKPAGNFFKLQGKKGAPSLGRAL